MFTQIMKCLLATILLGLLSGRACAVSNDFDQSVVHRDKTYEENLRWEASDDKTVTPASVIRWLRGARGSAVYATVSPAEFQPIVNVYNSHVRVIAAVAYKF